MKRITFALILGSVAFAQAPRDFYPWWDSPVSREIGLTDEQRSRVQEVVREYRDKLIDLRGALEKAEAALGDAFNEENFDARRATDAAERIAKTRAELTSVLSQMSIRLRSILTLQQWREIQRRRPQMPVGPGSPGPGMGPANRQGPMHRPQMGPNAPRRRPGNPQPPAPPAPPAPHDN